MNSKSMAGWIGFAGIVMVILGALSFFEGLSRLCVTTTTSRQREAS